MKIKNIWVSIDESTDTSGRNVDNIMVGANEIAFKQYYLLACKEMLVTNHLMVACLFNESLQLLLPNEVQFDNVLLLVMDSASYIKKAVVGISISYPNIIYSTYFTQEKNLIS